MSRYVWTRRAALAAFGASILARPAFAHRAHSALTTIEWNDRRSILEVTHRLHAHDAEVALADVMGVDRPTLDDLETLARLALYVEPRFALSDANGAEIVLELLGAEAEGLTAFIYQEARLEAAPEILRIRCDFMRDVFSNQTNQVNWRIGEEVRTARFSADDDVHELSASD